jgi:hypothetical protein
LFVSRCIHAPTAQIVTQATRSDIVRSLNANMTAPASPQTKASPNPILRSRKRLSPFGTSSYFSMVCFSLYLGYRRFPIQADSIASMVETEIR